MVSIPIQVYYIYKLIIQIRLSRVELSNWKSGRWQEVGARGGLTVRSSKSLSLASHREGNGYSPSDVLLYKLG